MRSPLEVLDFNSTKTFISPSAGQYPHLWLWDACFHAIILAQLRPELAERELDALFEAQQPDGMIPHVRFNPFVNPGQYRPNQTDWGTGGPVSGITQPPLVASALKIVFQRIENRPFLRRVYPRVVRFHQWLKKIRDPEDAGLVAIVHPWESGMDNSPSFDGLKDAFIRDYLPPGFEPPPRADTKRVPPEQRPTDDYYQFYWGLIRMFREMNWDQWEMARRSPFFVADVLFNSIWAKANEDLADLAWVLGKEQDVERFSSWSAQTRRALRHRCWHGYDGFFYAEDLRSHRLITVKTIAGFTPMFAKAVTPSMADALVEHLMDRRQFFYHLGVPSTSFLSPDFDADRYWRGCIWINMHWLLAHGLMNYGYFDIVSKIFAKSHQLVEKEGYWEYYDPLNGEGLGASHFSWSTLTETMKPMDPPPELRESILVLSPEEASRHPELRTLYRHPRNRHRQLTEKDITSVPPVFVTEVMQAIRQHPLTALSPITESQIPRRLRQVADITQRLIQEKRNAWPEYPRICDLVCLAGHEVFSGLGYRCQIRWTPDLHYFLLVKSHKGRPWIVDLSPSQFSWHPISRIPLLLERMSLAIEAALAKSSKPPLKLDMLLRETQYAVQSNWVQLERNRMDRYEREAFLQACRCHRALVQRLAKRMPLEQPYLQRYLSWLDSITHGASRRRE
jgi:mannosylglycerate hydrolase